MSQYVAHPWDWGWRQSTINRSLFARLQEKKRARRAAAHGHAPDVTYCKQCQAELVGPAWRCVQAHRDHWDIGCPSPVAILSWQEGQSVSRTAHQFSIECLRCLLTFSIECPEPDADDWWRGYVKRSSEDSTALSRAIVEQIIASAPQFSSDCHRSGDGSPTP